MLRLVFLVTLALTWTAVLHGLTMAVVGPLTTRRRAERPRPEEWPLVTLLVPAHDEEAVIERSLRAYLDLDYPRHRLDLVVVDDASSDATGAICDRVAAEDGRVHVLHVPAGEGGRGKPAALDRALPLCRGELVAVFDADSRPHRDALRRLVLACADGRYVAAVGRIRKVNAGRTLLTRLAALDFTTFQWTFQAGRARLFDLVLLTGTNYVVSGDVLRALGGWDTHALTEDLELSVRLYCAGERVAFVPEAVADEEDPATLGPWLRQRTRWLRGTYGVLFGSVGAIVRSHVPRAYILLWELVLLYGAALLGLVASQLIFYAGVSGLCDFPVRGPLTALWLLALCGFVVTTQVAAALESNDSWRTPFLALVMYLFYSPLWLLVVARVLYIHFRRGRGVAWDKTPRTSY